MSASETPPVVSAEDRTVAILAYVTIVGFVIALVIHSGKKTRLGAFHLRQMLGLIIGLIVASAIAIVPLLGWLASLVLWGILLVLWVIGLVAAINGQSKPVPLLGSQFQSWFGTAFD